MPSPTVQIGSFKFFPDNPLGVTFGINAASAYSGAAGTADAQLFIDLVALGASRVRYNIVREVVETAQGVFDWSGTDNLVYQANKVGLRVTLIARGFPTTNCPAWAADPAGPCKPGGTQTHTTAAAYIEYAVALAQRYSGDGNSKNAKAPDGSGKILQADCIEIGNEEFNTPSGSLTDCQDALRYVNYVRQIIPAMRKSVASGGGNWVPRPGNNFLGRIGQWGIVHSVQSQTQDIFNKLCFPAGSVATADPNYSKWNSSKNPHSVFGFDPTLGVQMLDYANYHNYTDIWNGPPDYDQGTQCHDIRVILNSVSLTDNTKIPIWCTETGADGLAGGQTETYQAKFYAANTDGSGAGVLSALYTHGCQHLDLFTINYAVPGTAPYTGEVKSIACKDSSAPSGYIRFQAFTRTQNFFNTNGATWTGLAVPNGFGGSGPSSSSRTRDIGTRFKLATVAARTRDLATRFKLTLSSRTRDVGTRFNLLLPSSRTRDVGARFNLLLPPVPQHDIGTRFNLIGISPFTPGRGLGVSYLGAPRYGDLSSGLVRGKMGTLLVTYSVAVSQKASALPLTYTVQAANVGILLVYYLISPSSAFSINGDASIIAPDGIIYNPRPVTGRTLLAGPLLQGYKTMQWNYTVLQEPEFQKLMRFYNPQNPTVILTYPDETGTWVQRSAQMLPPQHGTRSTVQVSGVSLQFTGLLT